MPSRTVGTGGDYLTWKDACDALVAASPLSENWTLTQISDTVESMLFLGSIVDFNGFTVLFTSDTPPQGDPTAGWITNLSGGILFRLSTTGGGTFEVAHLNVHASGGSGNNYLFTTSGPNVLVHDCIGINSSASVSTVFNLQTQLGFVGTYDVWNCVGRATELNADSSIFQIFLSAGTFTIENCIAHGADYGFVLSSDAMTVRNCVAIGQNVEGFNTNNNATGRNNASYDMTATNGWLDNTGGVSNIVAATEFTSLDETQSTYLKVTNDGFLHDGGAATTIAGNTAGIRGNQRPQTNGDISIGADEFLAAGGGSTAGGGGISPAVGIAAMAGRI